jgi:hypothetical protein
MASDKHEDKHVASLPLTLPLGPPPLHNPAFSQKSLSFLHVSLHEKLKNTSIDPEKILKKYF